MGMFDFIGDVVGGVAGVIGANKAAKIQKKALKQQKELSDQAIGYQEPYRISGTDAVNSLRNALGLGNTDAALSQFRDSPLYKLLYGDALREGNEDIMALASSRGQLNNGATLRALQDNRVNTANNFFSQYLQGLDSLATRGQNAATAAGNIAVGQGTNAVEGAKGIADLTLGKYLGIGNSAKNAIGNIGEMFGGYAGGGGTGLYGTPNLGNVNKYTGMIGGGV